MLASRYAENARYAGSENRSGSQSDAMPADHRQDPEPDRQRSGREPALVERVAS